MSTHVHSKVTNLTIFTFVCTIFFTFHCKKKSFETGYNESSCDFLVATPVSCLKFGQIGQVFCVFSHYEDSTEMLEDMVLAKQIGMEKYGKHRTTMDNPLNRLGVIVITLWKSNIVMENE